MLVPRHARFGVAALALLLLVGCGTGDETSGSEGDSSMRTIEVGMRDIAFSPTSIDVEAGETVRFVFKNTGAVVHEAYIGDASSQQEHADEMGSMGDMDHDMDGDVLTVEPGEEGELTYTFDETGSVQIGCHQPGHFEAGMVLDVDVR